MHRDINRSVHKVRTVTVKLGSCQGCAHCGNRAWQVVFIRSRQVVLNRIYTVVYVGVVVGQFSVAS